MKHNKNMSVSTECCFLAAIQILIIISILSSGLFEIGTAKILVGFYSVVYLAPILYFYLKRQFLQASDYVAYALVSYLTISCLLGFSIGYGLFIADGFIVTGLMFFVAMIIFILIHIIYVYIECEFILRSFLEQKAIDENSFKFYHISTPIHKKKVFMKYTYKLVNLIVFGLLLYGFYFITINGGRSHFIGSSLNNPYFDFQLSIVLSGLFVTVFILAVISATNRIISLIAILQWQKQNPDKPKLTLGWKRMSKEQ